MSSSTKLPIIYITPEAKMKLDLYIQIADSEISGLGNIFQYGNDLLITDVHLLQQECSGDSTELNPEAFSRFLLDIDESSGGSESLRLWWHSHVDMGCFWSPIDDSTAETYESGWLISLVGNKSGKYRARLDMYEPFRLTVDHLEMRVLFEIPEGLRERLQTEIDEKVTILPPKEVDYERWTNLDIGGYVYKGNGNGNSRRKVKVSGRRARGHGK